MKSFLHRLPPLKSLIVFEAAARLSNFTAAGNELHVSQAAVSKQIMLLEEHLGVSLFDRNGTRLTLTSRGMQLQEKVSASFEYLANSVESITQRTVRKPEITLSANTALSHFWLSHAINDFHYNHPECLLSFRIITSDHTPNIFSEDVDLALIYDVGNRFGWSMTELFPEELFPVASPDYLKHHPVDGCDPSNLLSHALLDFEQIEPNWINWKIWLTKIGVSFQDLDISRTFNNYSMVIDAAERGQGITLGTRYLLDDKLKRGLLVPVMDVRIQSGRNYYMALNENRPFTEKLRLVYNWFMQQNITQISGRDSSN